MKACLKSILGLAMLLFSVYPGWAQQDAQVRKAQSKALAQRIDRIISRRLQDAKLKPGPRAELAQLTRRLHIDLTGKIPSIVQLTDLIDSSNDSPTKLEDRIDALLADDGYAVNFAHYWRSVMLVGANNQPQFEAWLRARLRSNTGYDKMAHEVLMNKNPNQPGRGMAAAGVTPAAFYAVNANKAENLAGATTRVFLGVKMECAQCHKHPFAHWTRKQFWEFAAFFANGKGDAGRKILIPQTEQVVLSKFITGEVPDWEKVVSPREALADWTVSRTNPYFAKAAVDNVWKYFFGASLLEPILEQADDGAPAHAELLDEMARTFITNDFDLKFLIRAIVLTEAYQRASVPLSEASKLDLQMFARMPVRGMMPEQLYDCISVATDYREPVPVANTGRRLFQPQQQQNQQRAQFLATFTSPGHRTETHTSILQALYLMNGPFIRERSRQSLTTIAVQNTSTRRRVEALYMMVLSRLPNPAEMDRMVRFIDSSADPREAVVDVCWVLLNSTEFMLNY